MKKAILTFVAAFVVGFVGYANYLTYTAYESPTFKPTFAIDYTDCGEISFPSSEGSIQFGDASTSCGGRVVSNEGYINISQIRFTADLSNVSGNFVTSTFYMVNNPNNPGLKPLHENYCDAGGNNPSWNCQEVDFFEVNNNVVFQHTMHVGDGSSSAPQNFQLSYSTTDNQCFINLEESQGLVSWNGIDIKQPVDFVVDLDDSGMTVTVKQGSISTVVYTMGDAYPGSTVFDDDQIKRWAESRAQGYWLNLSRWQSTSWSPGSAQNLYNWNGPNCGFGNLCGATKADYFKIYDIEIDADSTL
ncbi:MAG: hypothetical protein H8E97_06770 [Bacteroidetes bacterium]|nr:hypothetical protein [Bacteroidota bacterium]